MNETPDPTVAPRPPRLLAGDRLIAAAWLTLVVVVARASLQVAVDYTGPERLRGTDLWEHAIEHVTLAASHAWILVVALTVLPCRRGRPLAFLRGAVALALTASLVSGLVPTEGEVQYSPGLESSRGLLGWAAVLVVGVGVALLDRWGTSARRRWWVRSPAFRFGATALVLVATGAVFVGVHKRIEHVRRYIYVQGPEADLLDEYRSGRHHEVRGAVSIESLFPGRSYERSGGNKPALVMEADSSVVFQVEVPSYSWLSFSYAASLGSIREVERRNDSWDPELRFRVHIDDEEVFDETLQPVGDKDHRQWYDARIELDDWEGEKVAVRFTMEGEGDGARSVRAGFGRPLLMRSTSVRRAPPEVDSPNVVLMVVDSLRADHLGCYGYQRPTSAHIDALAERSVVYANAQATSSWTWPSVASILTGRPPPSHGVVAEDRCFLSDRLDTLPELLQREGVSTAGWTNSPLVTERKNFAQGFEIWGERPFTGLSYVVGEFRGFVQRRRESQFFAYLHFAEPSAPYRPPARFRGAFASDDLDVNEGLDELAVELAARGGAAPPDEATMDQLRGLYDEELRTVDHFVGKVQQFLREAGVADRTVLIVVGSHGEEFLEHGGLQHGWTLHREVLDVPLIIHDPRREAVRVEAPVDLSGLCETVLRIAGVQLPVRFRRPAFEPFVQLNQKRPLAFAHTQRGIYSGELRTSRWSVRDDRYKLILETAENSNEPQSLRLFDLVSDPGEQDDLVQSLGPDSHPKLQRKIEELTSAWSKWLVQCEKDGVELPPEERLEGRFLPHLPGARPPAEGSSSSSNARDGREGSPRASGTQGG